MCGINRIRPRIHLCEYCCLSCFKNDAGWRPFHSLPPAVGFPLCSPAFFTWKKSVQFSFKKRINKQTNNITRKQHHQNKQNKQKQANQNIKAFLSKPGCSKNWLAGRRLFFASCAWDPVMWRKVGGCPGRYFEQEKRSRLYSCIYLRRITF